MKRIRSQWLVAASLTMGTLVASSCWAGEPINIGAQGVKQGVFRGLTTGPFRGMMPVTKFAFTVQEGLKLRGGMATGRRQYNPVRVTKFVDASSTQYLAALASNETLSNVTLNFVANSADGSQYVARTFVLTNAHVVAVEQYTEPDANGAPVVMEQISFTFQSYTFTDTKNNLVVHDDLLPPNS